MTFLHLVGIIEKVWQNHVAAKNAEIPVYTSADGLFVHDRGVARIHQPVPTVLLGDILRQMIPSITHPKSSH